MVNIIPLIMSIVAGAASASALFAMYQYPNIRVFMIAFLLWLLVIVGLENIHRRAKEHQCIVGLPLLLTTVISFTGLLSLLEWGSVIYFVIGLCAACMALLMYGDAAVAASPLAYNQKPFRRFVMTLWVVNAYAFATAIFAVGLFFQNVPFWSLLLLVGPFFAWVSYMVWKLYSPGSVRQYGFWMILIGVALGEIFWVLHILPYGYLASAFLAIWIWYIFALLIRFHNTPKGIIWRDQRWFIATNIVFFIAFLFFIKWI